MHALIVHADHIFPARRQLRIGLVDLRSHADSEVGTYATTDADWKTSVGIGWVSCQVMAMGRSPVWVV